MRAKAAHTHHTNGEVADSLENSTSLLGLVPNSNNQMERLTPVERGSAGAEGNPGSHCSSWKPCWHLGILENALSSSSSWLFLWFVCACVYACGGQGGGSWEGVLVHLSRPHSLGDYSKLPGAMHCFRWGSRVTQCQRAQYNFLNSTKISAQRAETKKLQSGWSSRAGTVGFSPPVAMGADLPGKCMAATGDHRLNVEVAPCLLHPMGLSMLGTRGMGRDDTFVPLSLLVC